MTFFREFAKTSMFSCFIANKELIGDVFRVHRKGLSLLVALSLLAIIMTLLLVWLTKNSEAHKTQRSPTANVTKMTRKQQPISAYPMRTDNNFTSQQPTLAKGCSSFVGDVFQVPQQSFSEVELSEQAADFEARNFTSTVLFDSNQTPCFVVKRDF